MAFEKGQSGNPAGRPKGSKNRSTKAMKEGLGYIIDDNWENISVWLEKMAEDDPKAALQCMLNMMEFIMPKMSRTTWIEEKNTKEKPSNNASSEIADSVMKALDQAIAEAEKQEFSGVREKREFIDRRAEELY